MYGGDPTLKNRFSTRNEQTRRRRRQRERQPHYRPGKENATTVKYDKQLKPKRKQHKTVPDKTNGTRYLRAANRRAPVGRGNFRGYSAANAREITRAGVPVGQGRASRRRQFRPVVAAPTAAA